MTRKRMTDAVFCEAYDDVRRAKELKRRHYECEHVLREVIARLGAEAREELERIDGAQELTANDVDFALNEVLEKRRQEAALEHVIDYALKEHERSLDRAMQAAYEKIARGGEQEPDGPWPDDEPTFDDGFAQDAYLKKVRDINGKIPAIKEARRLMGLGLCEAKEHVESL